MQQDNIHLYFLPFQTKAPIRFPVLKENYTLGEPSLPL